MSYAWKISEGSGTLAGASHQEIRYFDPAVPRIARQTLAVTLRDLAVTAEALITVTDSSESTMATPAVNARGLPGHTFERAAGQLRRRRFDAGRNTIVGNGGHRDVVFATRNRVLQLRYLVHLDVKEFVLRNFARLAADQLLERMIALSRYAEKS